LEEPSGGIIKSGVKRCAFGMAIVVVIVILLSLNEPVYPLPGLLGLSKLPPLARGANFFGKRDMYGRRKEVY
jgi:hypothetical protein